MLLPWEQLRPLLGTAAGHRPVPPPPQQQQQRMKQGPSSAAQDHQISPEREPLPARTATVLAEGEPLPAQAKRRKRDDGRTAEMPRQQVVAAVGLRVQGPIQALLPGTSGQQGARRCVLGDLQLQLVDAAGAAAPVPAVPVSLGPTALCGSSGAALAVACPGGLAVMTDESGRASFRGVMLQAGPGSGSQSGPFRLTLRATAAAMPLVASHVVQVAFDGGSGAPSAHQQQQQQQPAGSRQQQVPKPTGPPSAARQQLLPTLLASGQRSNRALQQQQQGPARAPAAVPSKQQWQEPAAAAVPQPPAARSRPPPPPPRQQQQQVVAAPMPTAARPKSPDIEVVTRGRHSEPAGKLTTHCRPRLEPCHRFPCTFLQGRTFERLFPASVRRRPKRDAAGCPATHAPGKLWHGPGTAAATTTACRCCCHVQLYCAWQDPPVYPPDLHGPIGRQ